MCRSNAIGTESTDVCGVAIALDLHKRHDTHGYSEPQNKQSQFQHNHVTIIIACRVLDLGQTILNLVIVTGEKTPSGGGKEDF